MDDAIMEDFQQTFPELDSVEALTKLNENEMKSPQGKERWRNFIMKVNTYCPPYSLIALVSCCDTALPVTKC
jgi:hypothetical protein